MTCRKQQNGTAKMNSVGCRATSHPMTLTVYTGMDFSCCLCRGGIRFWNGLNKPSWRPKPNDSMTSTASTCCPKSFFQNWALYTDLAVPLSSAMEPAEPAQPFWRAQCKPISNRFFPLAASKTMHCLSPVEFNTSLRFLATVHRASGNQNVCCRPGRNFMLRLARSSCKSISI